MKRIILAAGAAAFIAAGAFIPFSSSFGEEAGEPLFKQHCTACHPGGGNIINPQKTLHKKDRETNNVKTANDIVKLMRNPGPGMTKFDTKTISDKDAKLIANYVLHEFK